MLSRQPWKTTRLGDLISVEHGWPFKSELFSTESLGRPIVVAIGNFRYEGGFRFEETSTKEYQGEYPKKYELAAGDILLVMTCQTEGGEILGVPGRIPDDGRVYLHNQRMGKVVIRDGVRVDSAWLYQLFRWSEFNSELVASASGTKIVHTAPSRIEAFSFELPPLDEQRAIAEVLGALDDKIELNRQMNRTLEEMASALFKSWFVDFDPVVARSEGRQPFGMDSETAALFPAELQSGDDGDHPSGWRHVSLGEIAEKIGSGATPTGGNQVYCDGGVSFIRSQNVYDSQFIWDGLAHISDAHAKSLDGVTVKANDVLINITGASFLRTCVVDPDVLPARVNQHVAIVRAKKGVPPRFIHLHLVRPWMKEFLAGHDAGGSRQAITKAHLQGVPILLPPQSVLDAFATTTGPWFGLVEANTRESRTLTTLRDTLLPKLLSGEIRLRQAEKAVEAVL